VCSSDLMNDPEKSAIVIIMQRLHMDDVSGVIEQLGLDYVHLMLPMHYDPDRATETIIGFNDPRKDEGELLFPERFPQEVLDRDRKAMTSFAVASQWEQTPTPRAGRMVQREWWNDKIIDIAPPVMFHVRHWDLAATDVSESSKGARTAGVKMGLTHDGKIIVSHCVAERRTGQAVREMIKTQAGIDGPVCEISLPQDPGQAGKDQAQSYIRFLNGYNVRAKPETGSKHTRFEPFAAQIEGGNVYLVRGEWNEGYIDELCNFPSGSFADRVDASSGAHARLVAKMPSSNVLIGTYSKSG